MSGHPWVQQGKPKKLSSTMRSTIIVNPPRLHLPRPRGPNQPQVVVPHPIQQNKVEKTNIGGVVGFTRRKIIPIHQNPQLPTLTLATHVPIVMHMGMMSIIASHFTQDYGKANKKTTMLIMAKVLGRAKRGKVQPRKGRPPS